MLGLKLNHVSKRGHWNYEIPPKPFGVAKHVCREYTERTHAAHCRPVMHISVGTLGHLIQIQIQAWQPFGANPFRCQAIIWTNAGLLAIEPLWQSELIDLPEDEMRKSAAYGLHCPPIKWNHPTSTTVLLHKWWKSMSVSIWSPWQHLKDPLRPSDKPL